jgi:hypothetical protein
MVKTRPTLMITSGYVIGAWCCARRGGRVDKRELWLLSLFRYPQRHLGTANSAWRMALMAQIGKDRYERPLVQSTCMINELFFRQGEQTKLHFLTAFWPALRFCSQVIYWDGAQRYRKDISLYGHGENCTGIVVPLQMLSECAVPTYRTGRIRLCLR